MTAGQWLKLIAPGIVDNIAQRAIEEGRSRETFRVK
jgi:hypothetical protein